MKKKYILKVLKALGLVALILVVILRGYHVISRKLAENKPPACVVDIDQTITDGRHPARTLAKVPLLQARDALRLIKKKGIAIFYLSKRESYKLTKTRRWLREYGYPPGEMVILKRDLEEEGYYYKLREIRNIQKRYKVLCGFGNDNDLPIYRDAGIRPICRERWRDEDWLQVKENLEKIPAREEK